MIFRVEKNKDYTVMSNYHLRDKRMSLKAKGLLSWMLSNMDDWDYSIAGIVANCKENETAITSALKELKQFGYLTMTKEQSKETGRFEWIYCVYERPIKVEENNEDPYIGFPGMDLPGMENPVQINNKKISTKESNKTISKDIVTESVSHPEFHLGNPRTKKPNLYQKCNAMILQFTEDKNLQDMLRQYLDLRISMKDKPLYANSWKGILNALQRFMDSGEDPIQVLDQSMQRGYSQLYSTNKKQFKKSKQYVDDIPEGINGTREHYEGDHSLSGLVF